MKIIVNGQERDVRENTTLEELIREVGLADAACAAEVNQKLVPKRQRAGVTLAEGDRIELVTLVGGG